MQNNTSAPSGRNPRANAISDRVRRADQHRGVQRGRTGIKDFVACSSSCRAPQRTTVDGVVVSDPDVPATGGTVADADGAAAGAAPVAVAAPRRAGSRSSRAARGRTAPARRRAPPAPVGVAASNMPTLAGGLPSRSASAVSKCGASIGWCSCSADRLTCTCRRTHVTRPRRGRCTSTMPSGTGRPRGRVVKHGRERMMDGKAHQGLPVAWRRTQSSM